MNSPWPALSHATSVDRHAENTTSRISAAPRSAAPPGALRMPCRKERCACSSCGVATTKRIRSLGSRGPAGVLPPMAKREMVPEWQQSMKQVRFTPSGRRLKMRPMSSSISSAPVAKSTGQIASSSPGLSPRSSSRSRSGTWVPCPENWNTSTSPLRLDVIMLSRSTLRRRPRNRSAGRSDRC